ncbi:branched chain amino acid aminotransferase [Sporomusaceae bacterium FL31]|nr:branched chain amino acid aminotransferase [Sporomusaceae bacterium FL31]GCE32522.1 branched chain amino acid aminotransferase [Sporomusaceae bacterium]
MQSKMYINGQFIAADQAKISAYDHGFLYGNGLFETMRAYAGRVFRCHDHIGRIIQSADFLGWDYSFSADELIQAVYSTLKVNDLTDASIRLTISRGTGLARPDAVCSQPTLAVYAAPYQAPSADEYQTGWPAATASIRRNQTSPVCGIKSANYLDNLLARSEVKLKGAKEALLLNTDGLIAEGTIANYFFVMNGKLVTPHAESGLLPGITRAVVLELAAKIPIVSEVRAIYPEEIKVASEMFITNSLLEIMPVNRLDDTVVGNGQCGPVTQLLINQYKELVHAESNFS